MSLFSRHWRPWVGRVTLCVRLLAALALASATSLACANAPSGSPPEVLRDLTLVDQDGTALDPREWQGRTLLVNFMFTRCPGPCPRLTKLLANTRSRLGADVREQLLLLSLSVDPEHDSPEQLHEFAVTHAANWPNWRFSTLTSADLDRLSERLAVFDPSGPKAPAAHSMKIYLFDNRGRALQRYDGDKISADHLARELTAAVRLAGTNVDR